MYPYEPLLEDVEVPEENVIRAQGSGFAVAQERLVRTRVPSRAGVIGIGQKALEMAVDYARDRVTFGEPRPTAKPSSGCWSTRRSSCAPPGG